MDKKYKIIGGVCGAVCVGGLAAGIFFIRGAGEGKIEDMAYVVSVSSMNDMAGTQRLAGVVESQKTLEVQKDSEREVKEVLVKAGDDVEVGTPLFTYETGTLEMDIQQAQLDLERTDSEMQNLRSQIQQLEKEKKDAPEEEQFSYTTQIQTAQMDLKKSEYDKKAKEVEISRIQNQIDNSIVTGEYRVKGRVNEQNIGEIMEGEAALIRSRVDEDQVWTGTFTAVDTKNPESNSNMSYYTSSDDSAQTTSTSYPFYVDLNSSQGLLLGQHVYIEHDTGLSQREPGIWLSEAFIADLDKKPYVWAEKDGVLEKRDVILGTYDAEMMQYKIEDGLDNKDYVAYPQDFLKEGMKTTYDPAQAYTEEPEITPEDGLTEEMLPEDEITEEVMPEGEAEGAEGLSEDAEASPGL